jgi:hypothetical protein
VFEEAAYLRDVSIGVSVTGASQCMQSTSPKSGSASGWIKNFSAEKFLS